MNRTRFHAITSRYPKLRIAIVGDFCLDRYLEIDPERRETSLETGLPVHNVVRVRAQPGAAGTILNNLRALGVRTIWPVGFCGHDGEGHELRRAMSDLPLRYFFQTKLRHTFTYCKPLLIHKNKPPEELNRLDTKNWTPTPPTLQNVLIRAVRALAPRVDAIILLDQVDVPETGVVTKRLLAAVGKLVKRHPRCFFIGDSRRGLRDWPPIALKMNETELAATGYSSATELAKHHGKPVFVTMAERGILGALPDGTVEQLPALPVRGPIDIVGAGDAVTANLTTAWVAGATLREALELANAAASVVIHKLGTTGTATVRELKALVCGN
ncbi:MAG: PfkB family carbohydrate kinase [Verrucomicrobiae bacterium]|nr:PfkB family carbohydrate kinase [Verrucomicrobiae bacterium]